MKATYVLCLSVVTMMAAGAGLPAASPPGADETQLPLVMHKAMKDRAHVTVGRHEGDMTGADHRVLQAAVDYVAGLGGGTVEIGSGEFRLRDSLHLRPNVTVRGQGPATILRKEKSAVSALKLDGDYGEEQVTLVNPAGFSVGDGVAIWDRNAGGFHTTVARITGGDGDTFSISLPLNADFMVENGAQAATVFPVISGYHVEGARVEDLTIEGNSEENVSLNGCRGGGIFLFRCPRAVLERCTVRHYHGDGISFQQSNDVIVRQCTCESNAGLGLHPGSGSQRPIVSHCTARNNGEDGLFLCWRVKQGVFEENLLEGNGRYGISIGHKDTDNLLLRNHIRGNHEDGICFRNESEGMAGHRNRLEHNLIENNGVDQEAAGIRVRGTTRDLIFRENTIRDTRPAGERRQTIGIKLEENVGTVALEENTIEASEVLVDQRKSP